MFDKGENGPPWDFPLDNPLNEQNITAPPSTTEASAVKSYPLPDSSRHKKKKIGKVGKMGIMVGVGTLVVACFLLFFMIRHYKCARKHDRPESSEGSRHSLPISLARGKLKDTLFSYNCYRILLNID